MCDSLAKAGRRHARRGALGVVTPSGRIYSAAMVRLTRGAEAHLALLGYGDHLVQVTAARTAALRDRPGLSVSTSPVDVDAEPSDGDGSLQLLLLIVLFGYIATAVANSAGAAARLSMLRVIGTTPDQLRCIGRIEGLFLATVACVIGTVAAMPGLVSMTSVLAMER